MARRNLLVDVIGNMAIIRYRLDSMRHFYKAMEGGNHSALRQHSGDDRQYPDCETQKTRTEECQRQESNQCPS